MQVRRLPAEDVSLVAEIDRSEHVDLQYCVIDGELKQIPAAITEVAAWDPTGTGPHSVSAITAFCDSVVARGGILLGVFAGERTAGLAIVNPTFEPPLAWLAFLHLFTSFDHSRNTDANEHSVRMGHRYDGVDDGRTRG